MLSGGIVARSRNGVAGRLVRWVVPAWSAALPVELRAPASTVDRPRELEALVAALAAARFRGGTVVLQGPGGSGTTTLAQLACADRRVRRRFGGGARLVRLGPDTATEAAVAAKMSDLLALITRRDPKRAGRSFGSLLNTGPRRLLVLDDVRTRDQVAPFVDGGKRCVRLVTTPVPGLDVGKSTTVTIGAMPTEQARVILGAGLPPLEVAVVTELLTVTRCRPLLLRLVNAMLLTHAERSPGELSAKAAELSSRLNVGRRHSAEPGRDQEEWEKTAIRALLGVLERDHAVRLAELAVFAPGEIIPARLVARLWQATAGLKPAQAAWLCRRLALLGMVAASDRGITLHGVVRDALRDELGEPELAGVNGLFLDAMAADVPRWWDMDPGEPYLWDHLLGHLVAAGRRPAAADVAADVRWICARLLRSGPAAPIADLAVAGTAGTSRLAAVLAGQARLLAPTSPAEAVADIVCDRIAGAPGCEGFRARVRAAHPTPRLESRGSLADVKYFDGKIMGKTVRAEIIGRAKRVAAPDGSWLASVRGQVGTIQWWDVAAMSERAVWRHGDDVPGCCCGTRPRLAGHRGK